MTKATTPPTIFCGAGLHLERQVVLIKGLLVIPVSITAAGSDIVCRVTGIFGSVVTVASCLG